MNAGYEEIEEPLTGIFVNKQQGQILVPPSSEGGDDAEQSNAASKTTVSSDEVLTQKVVSKGKVPLSPTSKKKMEV